MSTLPLRALRAARSRWRRHRSLSDVPEALQPPGNPIFIVGLYKCGTSWLLACLHAHPRVTALREFDLVRAIQGGAGPLRLAPTPRRLEGFFSGSSWCKVQGAVPRGLVGQAAERAVSVLRETLAVGERAPARESRLLPRTFLDLGEEKARSLYESVVAAKDSRELFTAFLEIAVSLAAPGQRLALKAADQIAVFDSLQRLAPRAPKLAIVRDGRDAAISGQRYKELMRQQGAPWVTGSSDYAQLLRSWTRRARWVRERARRGEVYVVRYEDLTLDFAGSFAPLLRWLGLEHGRDVVEAIQAAADFEATTGRPRGCEARAVQRRGAIGEWLEVFAEGERERAWRIAGAELEHFGYSADGALSRLPWSNPGDAW